MARPRRFPAALRVLARRKAYLAAMAGAGLALTVVLLVFVALAALVAALLPADWPVATVGALLVAVAYLPVLAVALSFLTTSVRAYTLFTSGPPPSTPVGIVGGAAGLGIFLAGRRLRARRGLLGWLTDPWGAAAGTALSRALPPDHPLAALLQVAGLEPRRSPARGAALLAFGLVLTALALWLIIGQLHAGLGAVLLGPLVLFVPLAGVLGAALRGVLAGAWDRYLLDQMAYRTEATLGGVGRTFGGLVGGAPGHRL